MSILDSVKDWPERAKTAKYSARRLAKGASISPRHLRRHFAQVIGIPLRLFLRCLRLAHIERLLHNPNTLQEVGGMVGWESIFHLCREFKKEFGVSPARYRRRLAAAAAMAETSNTTSASSKPELLPSKKKDGES